MMMRVGLVGMFGALAGCGGAAPALSPEHVAFTTACTQSGGAAELCECRAGKLDELTSDGIISAEVARAYLLQEQGKEDEAQAIMETLAPADLLYQPMAIAEAEQVCLPPS
jgi:hypothetical protein